jgi:hypothetical protein
MTVRGAAVAVAAPLDALTDNVMVSAAVVPTIAATNFFVRRKPTPKLGFSNFKRANLGADTVV